MSSQPIPSFDDFVKNNPQPKQQAGSGAIPSFDEFNGRVQGIPATYNGGQPPAAATPQPPEGLRDPEYNFWTSPTGLIRTGLKQAAHGVEAMAEPGMDAKMEGASQALHGISRAATPVAIPTAVAAAVPALAAAPLATLGGIAGAVGGGGIASELGKRIVKYFGAGEGASDLAGDVAGAVGSAAGAGLGALSGKAIGGLRDWASQRDPEAIKDAVIGIIPRGSKINNLRHLPTREDAAAALAERQQSRGPVRAGADGNLYRIKPDNTAVPIIDQEGQPMKGTQRASATPKAKPKPAPPLGRTINPAPNTKVYPAPAVAFKPQPQEPAPTVMEPPPVKFRAPAEAPAPKVYPAPPVAFKPAQPEAAPEPVPVFRTPATIPPVESTPGAAAQPGSSLAQPGGIQPIQASTTNAPFTVTPGEGTHLGLEVKPGQIPAKADYQAAARNTWASHIARDLQRRNVSLDAFNAMTDTELNALAKELGLNPSSAAKRSIVVKKLSGK